MQSVQDLNISLLQSARQIVEARRGPMPAPIAEPGFGYGAFSGNRREQNLDRVQAYWDRQSARSAYEREVRETFRTLKADVVLAPTVSLGVGRVAA